MNQAKSFQGCGSVLTKTSWYPMRMKRRGLNKASESKSIGQFGWEMSQKHTIWLPIFPIFPSFSQLWSCEEWWSWPWSMVWSWRRVPITYHWPYWGVAEGGQAEQRLDGCQEWVTSEGRCSKWLVPPCRQGKETRNERDSKSHNGLTSECTNLRIKCAKSDRHTHTPIKHEA